MKIRNCLSLLILIITVYSAHAQNDYKFSISINAGMSKTGSLKYGTSYRAFEALPTVNISKIGFSQNNNFNFEIGYHPSKSFSLNGSIGVASYGFRYTGDVIASPTNSISVGGFKSKDTYSTRLMEVGVSAKYLIKSNDAISFFIQPGIAWYTNQKGLFSPILFIPLKSNSFSATLFAGVQVPINNNFHVSAGISSKLALHNFAVFYDYDNQFYPYALGLQTTLSYRIGSRP